MSFDVGKGGIFISTSRILILMAYVANALPSLQITNQPPLTVLQTDTMTIRARTIPASENAGIKSCRVMGSYQPQGNRIAGHTISIQPISVAPGDSEVTVRFSPGATGNNSNPQLELGIAYYVISCGPAANPRRFYSPELMVRIETAQKPTLITPSAVTNSTKPLISWQGVMNVPAYHVIVSDQVISFDEINYTVTGISIIWQAITAQTSISYGETDPSGAFPGVEPPPLIPDKKYTLILLNNYDGKSMNATSDKAKEFRIFSVNVENDKQLVKPKLLLPYGEDTLAASSHPTIRFLWTDSAAKANTYSLYIYSLETLPGFDNPILMPVYSQELTDTSLILNSRETLSNRRYYFKVFAHSAGGLTKVSDTASFFYQIDERELIFNTYTHRMNSGGMDTVPLGDVTISVLSIDRNQDMLPLVTDIDGWAARKITYGTYRISFSKSGYIPYDIPIVLSDTNSSETIRLFPVLSEYPASVMGRITDGDGLVIPNTKVTAISQHSDSSFDFSDANGLFEIGLSPGSYRLKFKHPDYREPQDTSIMLQNRHRITLPPVVLVKIHTRLSGLVQNTLGHPLADGLIQVKNSGGSILSETKSNDEGRFSFALVQGTYKIVVKKTGFSTVEKTIQFLENQNITVTLIPGASIISGTIMGVSIPIRDPIRSPLANAALVLTHENGSESLHTSSDKSGNYIFSVLEPGKYALSASHPGAQARFEGGIELKGQSATLRKNIQLNLKANLSGTITLDPDSALPPSALPVYLISIENLRTVSTAFPVRTKDAYRYSFEYIPIGSYQLSAGGNGYVLDEPAAVEVPDGKWISQDINLVKSDLAIPVKFEKGNTRLSGLLECRQPFSAIVEANVQKLYGRYGAYKLNAIPDDNSIIPLENLALTIDSNSKLSEVLSFQFPFFHTPQDSLKLKEGKVSLTLWKLFQETALDSGYLAYRFQQDWKRLSFSGAPKRGVAVSFRPPPEGGEMAYYFGIYANGRHYSNTAAPRQFRTFVHPSPSLASIRFDKQDSIYIALGHGVSIRVRAYDHAGQSLDSALADKGTIRWNAPKEIKLERDKTNPLHAAVTAPSGNTGRFTLSAEASLDDVSVKKKITLIAVKESVNKLALISNQGRTRDITTDTKVEFFVYGYDSSLTPPIPVETDAELSLEPEMAGRIQDKRLILHPDFIGPLKVVAKSIVNDKLLLTHLGEELPPSLQGFNIGQIITGQKTSRSLFHDSCFTLTVYGGPVQKNTTGLMKMQKRKISSQFTSTKNLELLTDLYEIYDESGAAYQKLPEVILSIPTSRNYENIQIGIFSDSALSWIKVPKSDFRYEGVAGTHLRLKTEVSRQNGFFYGIITNAKELSVDNFTITPNPFSPFVKAVNDGNKKYGAKISFIPHSNLSDRVTITLKILNMRGELIRVIEPLSSIPKQPVNDCYWDGKTDNGRWARNGRYVVMLIIKEAVHNKYKKYIKPIVLLK